MKKLLVGLCAIFICTFAIAHTINWHVGDQIISTTTCDSGDSITPPTAPEKYGYHFVEWEEGKNLFHGRFERTGYYISAAGVISPTSTTVSGYTYLIPVEPNTVYTFSSTVATPDAGANKRIHAYDANGNWIEQVGIEAGPSGYYTIIFTTPSNCKYVRLSMYITEIEPQLELGSSATEYEP